VPEGHRAFGDFVPEPEARANALKEKYKGELRAAYAKSGEREPTGTYSTGGEIPQSGTLAARRVTNSAMFNYSDEARAAAEYANSLAGDLASGSYPDYAKANEAYDQTLAQARAELEYARERNGRVGTFGLDLLGGATPVGVGGRFVQGANTLGGRLLRLGAVGGGYGSVSGFGGGEGGFTNRLGEAGWGGLTGAVTAPVLGEAVLPAATWFGRQVVSGANRILPRKSFNVYERLADRMEAEGITPADLAARRQEFEDAGRVGQGNAAPVDIPYVVADLTPGLRNEAAMAKRTTTEGNALAQQYLLGRQRGNEDLGLTSQNERFSDAIERALAVTRRNAVSTETRTAAQRRADADAAYRDFREQTPPIPVADVLAEHANETAPNIDINSPRGKALEEARNLFVGREAMSGGTSGNTATRAASNLERANQNIAMRNLDRRIARASDPAEIQDLIAKRDALDRQFQLKTSAPVNIAAPNYELTPAQFLDKMEALNSEIDKAARSGDRYLAGQLNNLKQRLQERARTVQP
jgi:hypothetical protein